MPQTPNSRPVRETVWAMNAETVAKKNGVSRTGRNQGCPVWVSRELPDRALSVVIFFAHEEIVRAEHLDIVQGPSGDEQ